MDKDSFVFYRSFAEAIDDLPDEQQLIVYRAIKEYALNRVEIELNGVAKSFWKLIKPQLEANNRRYNNGTKGAEYGKMGGRPKKETPNENNENPTGVIDRNPIGDNIENPKETPNENDNVNENVNVNVNEKENGVSFSENSPKTNSEPPPDKPSQTKEDATTVFQKARNLWNERKLPPQCRDLIIPPSEYDCLRTFQNYSWVEIENSIKNYHWHKTGKCGEGWAQPPPYGSIYGFLKKGVERYYDDDALESQFKENYGSRK
jgi:hypothetical protein